MTQIAGEVLQTVKLSLRQRAPQNSAGGGNRTRDSLRQGEKQARIILGGTMKNFVAKPRGTVIKKESMLTMHATPSKRGIAYLLA